MTKKILYLGVIGVLISSIISCEKDFTEVGSTIIDNSKFSVKQLVFDVEMNQEHTTAVQSGNTEISYLDDYLLGIYKKENAKTIKAGIVSQLIVPTPVTTELESGESLSTPNLDEVILKIPVRATLSEKSTIVVDGEQTTVPFYTIDSLLGNPQTDFTIKVYRNNSYLNEFGVTDPSKKKKYYSNDTYSKGQLLYSSSNFNYQNLATDTLFIFDRTLSNGTIYQDTLKVNSGTSAIPFITMKLDKAYLETEIFDKYKNDELSDQGSFNNFFKGIIIEVEGTDGAMIPLTIDESLLKPSIDFISTTTIVDATNDPILDDNNNIKKIESVDSFFFGGIRTSTYTMSAASSVADNVVIQGTAGSFATVRILNDDTDNNGVNDLDELKNKSIIINDATLILDINTTVADTTFTPKRLFLHKNEPDLFDNSIIIPKYISDLFSDGVDVFGGKLQLENEKPNQYIFRIRKHVTDIVKDEIPNSDLTLKVFNSIDYPTSETDLTIKEHNWNPRSVILLNKSTEQGNVRGAKLVITYTEEKTN